MHLFTQTVVIEKKKHNKTEKLKMSKNFSRFERFAVETGHRLKKKKKKQGIEFFTVVMRSL